MLSLLLLFFAQGEYRINVKAIFNCNNTTRDDKIYFDLKTNGNIVKGNGTLKIPLDDTIAVSIKARILQLFCNFFIYLFFFERLTLCKLQNMIQTHAVLITIF